MNVLKFTLSGRQAFFKKPEVNSYFYFTYGQIHKPALLGILGAIMGYSGYNSMCEKDRYPEYYEKLMNLKISVSPAAPKGYFRKKVIEFNNSVGYASKEQGGNLIVREQWLENPSWNIYLLLDGNEAEQITQMITAGNCIYIPYLGKNDHIADISDICVLEGLSEKQPQKIDSLFPKELIRVDREDWDVENPFKYEESLPLSLEEETNLYEMKSFVYTNMPVVELETDVYKIEDKNIVFY